ncbi:group III truncated hemoglobin [Ilumatobacter nonamiensis]|uniref:group III truncated hemoglobin n=1 Tax=Ilumatobacter nonamiensis TaxID=467093 RepID=UPI0011D2A1B3|nr:group III truncated hemoglobin [Ilumatobacter nonamiensis]
MTDAELAARGELADRDDIELLVRSFYRYAAMDELLGPVFSAAHVSWPDHIDTVTDFWVWQLLGERGYVGNPLRAHEPVHARTPFTDAHYERWLELFHATVDELFVGTVAAVAKQRATKMASALRRLLDGVHGAPNEPTQPTMVAPASSSQRRRGTA